MRTLLVAAVVSFSLVGTFAYADPGFSVGGSVGSANIKDDDDEIAFDDEDFAYKLFANYTSQSGIGLEGGYVDFGEPNANIFGTDVGIDASGWNLYAVGNLPLSGNLDLFAKAGIIDWDADAVVDGFELGEDDGTDLALSIGARWNVSDSFGFRTEFDWYDVADVDELWMLSVGLELRFN